MGKMMWCCCWCSYCSNCYSSSYSCKGQGCRSMVNTSYKGCSSMDHNMTWIPPHSDWITGNQYRKQVLRHYHSMQREKKVFLSSWWKLSEKVKIRAYHEARIFLRRVYEEKKKISKWRIYTDRMIRQPAAASIRQGRRYLVVCPAHRAGIPPTRWANSCSIFRKRTDEEKLY